MAALRGQQVGLFSHATDHLQNVADVAAVAFQLVGDRHGPGDVGCQLFDATPVCLHQMASTLALVIGFTDLPTHT